MAGFASSFGCVLLISSVLLDSYACASEVEINYSSSLPIVKGLSWSFYESSCPKLESVVRKELKKIFKKDIGQAAGLLRLHFQDCFVQVTKIHISLLLRVILTGIFVLTHLGY
jgi:peroxidase